MKRPRVGRTTQLAAATLGLVTLAALAAPWIAPFDPAAQLDVVALKHARPSAAHWLGTDAYSRDLLSRLLYGARTSLKIGGVGALLAAAIATVWGTTAAFLHPRAGDAMMGFVDLFRAIPRKIVLLSVLLLVPQPSLWLLAILLGATSWTTTSRVMYVHARVVRVQDFVASARALGVPPLRLLSRHVAPHLAGPLVSASAVLLADLLAMEAGLSFIGLGVRPPAASWGSILQDGVPYLASAWWVAAAPSVMLVLTVLSVAHLADVAHERGPNGRTT